jgi:putative ABC transport system permease protein
MRRSRPSTILAVALRYLGARSFVTWVSVLAIALSVLLVVAMGNINFAVKKTAVEGSIRYPLLVGPEGASSAQLVFSTIFHVDKPVGTIPFSVYEKLRDDRRAIAAYPLAMADSVESYPIIGTNGAFLADLGVGAASGALALAQPGDAVLGSEVAARTGLRLGDAFRGAHGMVGGEGAHEHAEITYRVVGILARTDGPEDGAAYTSYDTVWKMHAGGDHDEEGAEEKGGTPGGGDKYRLGEGRLTAVLVRTANPVYTAMLEREATESAGTQGVDTGRAIRRMVEYLNKGERAIEAFGAVTLAVAVAMILVTIVMSLAARRKELALMRCLGVGRLTIASIVMVEALVITLGGAALGVALGHLGVWWSENLIKEALGVAVEPWTWTAMEGTAVVTALAAGQLLALVSLVWTYRMNLVEEVARD